jgi:hypothetical protein
VYSPGEGHLKRLDVNFGDVIHANRAIYDLYSK